MRPVVLALIALTSLASGAVHSEGGCPPGYMPINASAQAGSAASLASCAPIPSADPARSPWKTRWGAIASDQHGHFGYASGSESERKAKREALAQCEKGGGRGCTVDLAYRNQCAAVVASGTQVFTQGAAFVEDAIAEGERRCKESNSTKCWVHYSNCSLPTQAR